MKNEYYGYKKQNLKQKIYSSITGVHGPWATNVYTKIDGKLFANNELLKIYTSHKKHDDKIFFLGFLAIEFDSKNTLTRKEMESIISAIEN